MAELEAGNGVVVLVDDGVLDCEVAESHLVLGNGGVVLVKLGDVTQEGGFNLGRSSEILRDELLDNTCWNPSSCSVVF